MKHCSRIVPGDWHLVLCKPNQNHVAFRNLRALGVDLFMPRHRASHRWRGRLREEIRPVFAGYIFIATDPERPRWDRIGATPGVSRLIRFGTDRPARVPAEIVAGLMARCDAEGLLRPMSDDLSVGDRVRVLGGPFHDFLTCVEQIDPDRRLHVLLDLLGQRTRVRLDPSAVVKTAE